MSAVNWTCPHCERAVTITEDRRSSNLHTLEIGNAEGRRTLATYFFVCPNVECRRFTLRAILFESRKTGTGETLDARVGEWALIPASASKHFPDYIPQAIRDDYKEACLIRDLSPKASATLSRRCLQGILRDFWKVVPGRLVDEIEAIKDRIDPLTWDAIDAVRSLGNIGAHMEKDINIIIDVDPGEATLLIGLVETLLDEWYVARETKRLRMEAVVAAAAGKKAGERANVPLAADLDSGVAP